jgi:glycosyltransferase involved in cell wall biosynthesis
LESLVNQSFPDFEVIVGNDYVPEPLSADVVGIEDPRIRYVNHSRNLGELRNLNALLEHASGEYFTWQFDDDLYALDFFERARTALENAGWPACAFTSYRKIFDRDVRPVRPEGFDDDCTWLSGPVFLERYLQGKLRAMGLTGVFKVPYIREIGGAKPLTHGPFALYSEYLLLVQTALVDRVAYVDAPLVYYFVHEASWGNVNAELELYEEAARNLLTESVHVLDRAGSSVDRESSIRSLLKMVVADFVKHACVAPGFSGLRKGAAFSRSMTTRFLPDGLSPFRTRGTWFVIPFLKAKLKQSLPSQLRVLMQKVHARFQS